MMNSRYYWDDERGLTAIRRSLAVRAYPSPAEVKARLGVSDPAESQYESEPEIDPFYEPRLAERVAPDGDAVTRIWADVMAADRGRFRR